MPRRGINDLPSSPRARRPDCAPHTAATFETVDAMYEERRTRAKGLKVGMKLLAERERRTAKAAARLARRLERAGDAVLLTRADPVWWREQRLHVAGQLWLFLKRYKLRRSTHFITVIPRDWQFTPEELLSTNPKLLIKAFRSVLDRLGSNGGFLIAFIDGEYDERLGHFQLHLHGIVQGDMLRTIRRLRTLSRFKSEHCSGQPEGSGLGRLGGRVVNPVQIEGGHLRQLPRPLTYLLKQFWPATYSFGGDAGDLAGRDIRSGSVRRISEPAHSVSLLWRDRWGLKDITLLIGVWVGRDGFTLS